MNAFKNRYGLVRIDLENRNRIKKQSAYWYEEMINNRFLEVADQEYK
ncbi:family 1 glycosylhydrolase [Jeotgalibaca sp. PTS2502]|nr:family 1 glycosylhydrolase [Jeotgalibaca sp. PTS2502]